MSTFVKFNSIENTYRQQIIDKIVDYGYDKGEWVALEKAHGSNVSFIVDKDGVRYGRRTGLLTSDEAQRFYNSYEVFQKYTPLAQKVWELVGHPGTIIIYGELIGGYYPGMKRPTKTTTTVQKGVYYCPHNEFYAFDIRIIDETNDCRYLDYDYCAELFSKVGMVFSRALYRGSFIDVLEWSKQHNADVTRIPDLFNLDPIDNNIREGHILKPSASKSFNNDSRVILKDKNERFAEKTTTKIQRLQNVEDPPHLIDIISGIYEYITDTRLDNVLSKEGPEINSKNIGKLMGLLAQDALKDWGEDYKGASLEKEDRKLVNKRAMTKARQLVLARL